MMISYSSGAASLPLEKNFLLNRHFAIRGNSAQRVLLCKTRMMIFAFFWRGVLAAREEFSVKPALCHPWQFCLASFALQNSYDDFAFFWRGVLAAREEFSVKPALCHPWQFCLARLSNKFALRWLSLSKPPHLVQQSFRRVVPERYTYYFWDSPDLRMFLPASFFLPVFS